MSKPKILLFDIETAPSLGYVWGRWEQNVIEMKDDWFMLSMAYKWLGQKKVQTRALPDYSLYKTDKSNDVNLTMLLRDLFHEADIVIGHNAAKFDVRKSNARFVYHGLKPPSPYKIVDTLTVARRYFKFDSNKLDDLARHLKIGEKLPHSGFKHTWLGCMSGDKNAWEVMRKYNAHDVELLEGIYKKFLPFITNHPNYNVLMDETFACPNCGSTNTQRRGYSVSRVARQERHHCQECGAWSSKPMTRGVLR